MSDEVASIQQVARALDPLTPAERERVVNWAKERYLAALSREALTAMTSWMDQVEKLAEKTRIEPGRLLEAMAAVEREAKRLEAEQEKGEPSEEAT